MDKVKILFLASDPSNAARLRLGEELRDIRETLRLSKKRDAFSIESRESVRIRDITQAIFDVEPQIVHFSGHGMSTGELCFENDRGETQPVSPNALANLFGLVAKQVSCVVLNACYSEAQAQAIAEHIPYVIGLKQAIEDKAAIKFSVAFYKALGANYSYYVAYEFARAEIQLEGIPEHLTPVLHLKNLLNESTVPVSLSQATSSFQYPPSLSVSSTTPLATTFQRTIPNSRIRSQERQRGKLLKLLIHVAFFSSLVGVLWSIAVLFLQVFLDKVIVQNNYNYFDIAVIGSLLAIIFFISNGLKLALISQTTYYAQKSWVLRLLLELSNKLPRILLALAIAMLYNPVLAIVALVLTIIVSHMIYLLLPIN